MLRRRHMRAKTHADFFGYQGSGFCIQEVSVSIFFLDVDEHLRNLRWSVGREKSRRRIWSNLRKTLIVWSYWFFVDKLTPNLRKATFASCEFGHCHYHTFKIVFSVVFGTFCVLLLAFSYALLSSRPRHFRHWTFCKSSSCLFCLFVCLLYCPFDTFEQRRYGRKFSDVCHFNFVSHSFWG